MEALPLELVSLILSNVNIESLLNFSLVSANYYLEAKRILNLEVAYYPNSNIVQSKKWYDKKGNSRVIVYNKNNIKQLEKWFNQYDVLHRLTGPAYQNWHTNGKEKGQKICQAWYKDGKRHRLDGPTIQRWYNNGQKEREAWYIDDRLHRLDGPADQYWYENGQIEYEKWYKNGRKHRIFGPAVKRWTSKGKIMRWGGKWYKHGIKVDAEYD